MTTSSTPIIVAFPSAAPGGLDAPLAAHFGHCDVFTLATLGAEGILKTEVVANAPHEQGGCLAPVGLLAGHGARALVVLGMGPRPLQGFNQAGIAVFHCGDSETVGEALDALLAGQLPQFGAHQTCGCHH
jgi:predicted Fe-Mo cluster-binding NifX family protein